MLHRVSRRHAASDDNASTLTAYLREIAKLPRLTVDEERALTQRIHDDRDVFTHNYRTAVTVGAHTVVHALGLTGKGIGVAVIDSRTHQTA